MPHTRTIHAEQATLQPIHLQGNADLLGVHEDWRHTLQACCPCTGLYLHGISGQPGGVWQFQSAGAAAFSLNILLEGRMETGFAEDGTGIAAHSGCAIVMAADHHTSGWNVLDSQAKGVFRMLGIHLPQTTLLDVVGLEWETLLGGLCGHTGHSAVLTAVPVCASVRRTACELLALLECDPMQATASHALHVRAKALQTIAYFLQAHVEPQQLALPAPLDRSRLRAARVLLENHYGEPWSVAALARAVGLHEKRLQSGFRALYGQTVHACLLRIRLDAAMALLQSGCNVTEAATCCGFTSLSHFGRMFRSATGLSPGQWAGRR